MIQVLIHVIFLLFLPPLLLGIINKTKALFGGRVGVPLLQTYYDIFKLMQKSLVISSTTSLVFQLAPFISLSALLLAGLLIPLGSFNAPVSFVGDFILFAYLFALSRFFTVTAALDTGSAFEGMGAAREVTFACLTEPATFFSFLVMIKITGTMVLTDMLSKLTGALSGPAAGSLVLIAIGMFLVMLTETCRIPVDDPNTHLELTMIHEVMVLDHSGPLLGLIHYSAALKLFIFGSVLLHVLLPFKVSPDWLNGPFFILSLIVLSAVIGIVESVMARLRMQHVPLLLISALLFCGFGFVLLVR